MGTNANMMGVLPMGVNEVFSSDCSVVSAASSIVSVNSNSVDCFVCGEGNDRKLLWIGKLPRGEKEGVPLPSCVGSWSSFSLLSNSAVLKVEGMVET